MRRRTVLIGAGSLLAGGGAVLSTGAFSSSSAYGTVDVTVTNEAVTAYPSHEDAKNDQNSTASPTVSGTSNESSVNVQKDAFALRHTDDAGTGYEVSVTLIKDSGADLDDLAGYLGDDIVDFRLLTTANGDSNRTFIDTDTSGPDMRDTLADKNGDDVKDTEYLDHERKTRTYVPDVGEAGTRGPVTLSANGETLQIAAVISVTNDAQDTRLPDFRVDVTETG